MQKAYTSLNQINLESLSNFKKGDNIQIYLLSLDKKKGNAKLLLEIESTNEIVDAAKELINTTDFSYNEVTVKTVSYEELVSAKKKYLEEMIIIKDFLKEDFNDIAKTIEFTRKFKNDPKLQYEVYSSYIKNHSSDSCKLI